MDTIDFQQNLVRHIILSPNTLKIIPVLDEICVTQGVFRIGGPSEQPNVRQLEQLVLDLHTLNRTHGHGTQGLVETVTNLDDPAGMHSSIVRGFPVNCPDFGDQASIQRDSTALEVSVDKNGHIYVGPDLVDLEKLEEAILDATAALTSEKILVRGDQDALYGQVAMVLARVSKCVPEKQTLLITSSVHTRNPG